MLVAILTLIVSIVVSYLVTKDASLVTLHLGASTLYQIPLFFVVFASIVLGMLFASVTIIKNLIVSKLRIFGQNNDLEKSYKAADDLHLKVAALEKENLKLKEQIKKSGPSQLGHFLK